MKRKITMANNVTGRVMRVALVNEAKRDKGNTNNMMLNLDWKKSRVCGK